ncbi:hypothetical protein [Mesorhizobium kowhaii]|uniref:hypothetical protein n=1 Tax=Mesorhizobium kowhaii TaxID=1300272 RepID=UPI001ABF2717|nr:hypothetical protein [Mesorhizobium kowhaii]
MPKSRIMYIENKSASLNGPAWVGRVMFSQTCKSMSYRGRTFQSLKGSGFKANYFDIETGERFGFLVLGRTAKIGSIQKVLHPCKLMLTSQRNTGVRSGKRRPTESDPRLVTVTIICDG